MAKPGGKVISKGKSVVAAAGCWVEVGETGASFDGVEAASAQPISVMIIIMKSNLAYIFIPLGAESKMRPIRNNSDLAFTSPLFYLSRLKRGKIAYVEV
jgi:hypothetical protein